VEFPAIQRQPYRFTLAPYSFLWLELQQRTEPAEASADFVEQAPLDVTDGWEGIFSGASRDRLESMYLPEYLPKQRWFAGKSRRIKSSRIVDWAPFKTSQAVLAWVEVQFDDGLSDAYLLPLATTFAEPAEELRRTTPNAVVASVLSENASGVLHDGVFDDQMCLELLSLIQNDGKLKTRNGEVQALRGKALDAILRNVEAPVQVRRGSAEQSNTSIVYGDRFILKLFRRQSPGVNPDSEVSRYLTEKTTFDRIPPFAGSIDFQPDADAEGSSLALLQGFVANEGDGWKWTLEEIDRYLESCAPLPIPESLVSGLKPPLQISEHAPSQMARDHVGLYLDSADMLGRRTAEMHLALASPTDDPAFAPLPLTPEDLDSLLANLRDHATHVFDVLKERVSSLPDDVVEAAAAVLSRRRRILHHFKMPESSSIRTQRIRIHGDYHLGQVLKVRGDFVILDFEGEPARRLHERRSKQCPLKDVAGMLRSFSYAAYASLINYTTRRPEDFARLEPWAQLWERSVSAQFLRAYRETAHGAAFMPGDIASFGSLLDVFLADKALYEILYEMNTRPAWVRIPLAGIMSLAL